jgi:hypothetical protein
MANEKVAGADKPSVVSALEALETGHAGAASPRGRDRLAHDVLLPSEAEGLGAEAKVAAGIAKLAKSGILWKPKDAHGRIALEPFLEDIEPGLSTLEADIVRLQVEAWVRNQDYDSALIQSADIGSIAESLKGAGTYSKDVLLRDVLALAEKRDDELDAKMG